MNNPVVKRMSLLNMGCRVNWTEMEQLRQQGVEQGYQPVGEGEAADLVVINTCSVTGESERQARQLIRRVVRENPGARVVVTGCYAERDPAALSAMTGVDRVVGNREKSNLLKWIEPGPRPPLESCPPAVQAGVERARVFLQVQNGCSQRCTFCVIPPLRGQSRSLPLEEALQQAQRHVDSGIREVVLSGINLGEYGVDLLPPLTLAHLVEQVSQIVGLERLRLSSIHPADLTDELLAWFADSPRLCNHLHLSVQSGDSLILKRMGRHYGREYLCQRLAHLRTLRPDMVLGGDFIVGFPTESDEAFKNTLSLVEEEGFSLLHVFPYSDRPDTPAAAIGKRFHVPGNLLRHRSRLLREAGRKNLLILLRNLINQVCPILVESVENRVASGKSSGFLPVVCQEVEPSMVGHILSCQIIGVDEDRGTALARPLFPNQEAAI